MHDTSELIYNREAWRKHFKCRNLVMEIFCLYAFIYFFPLIFSSLKVYFEEPTNREFRAKKRYVFNFLVNLKLCELAQ